MNVANRAPGNFDFFGVLLYSIFWPTVVLQFSKVRTVIFSVLCNVVRSMCIFFARRRGSPCVIVVGYDALFQVFITQWAYIVRSFVSPRLAGGAFYLESFLLLHVFESFLCSPRTSPGWTSNRSVAYFGVYELLKDVLADSEGKVSSLAILSAGGFAGRLS